MTRTEFFEWLDKCPTHKWEVTADEYGCVVVSFPTDEEDEVLGQLSPEPYLQQPTETRTEYCARMGHDM